MNAIQRISAALCFACLIAMLGCIGSSETTTVDIIDDTIPGVVSGENKSDNNDSSDAPADDEASTESTTDDDSGVLTIGSKAPSLDIQHWLSKGNGQFAEVSDFEAGKVYVVEFWATWCGPCISSMPHLAETQERYAEKGVQLISVSKEDLATVKGFLDRKVRGGEEDGPATYGELTSVYCLTTDPDGSVSDDYMKAAGQNGIPTAFIVGKTGQVEWIGHPMSMDVPLAEVVDDQWDRDQFAATFKAKQATKLTQMKIMSFARKGDFESARQALNEAKDNAASARESALLDSMSASLNVSETMALIKKQDAAAVTKLNEMAESKSDPRMLNAVAWAVYEQYEREGDIPEDLRDTAIAVAEVAVEQSPTMAPLLDTLAHLVHLQGDLDRALELQTKAAELGGSSGEQIQAFLDELIAEKKGAE